MQPTSNENKLSPLNSAQSRPVSGAGEATDSGQVQSISEEKPQTDLASVELPASADRFEAQLRSGYYTGILVTYGVKWNLEKVARDALQNFFDPNLSLDPVKIEFKREGLPFFRTYRVHIEADAEYGYQKLLHMGGTGKAGQTHTAGGFGEGAKILALVLLRDYKFTQVRFASGDWQIDFYLANPPIGSYDENVKGLHCKLTTVPHKSGNSLEFVCASKEHADAFLAAKDLFHHSANPDFSNPTMVVQLPGGGEAGFKLLGKQRWYGLNNGHLYDAGQRRHYGSDGSWDRVAGLHVWTLGTRVFHLDRDRGIVTSEALKSELLSPMVNAMNRTQLTQSIEKMEAIWPRQSVHYYEAAYELLEKLVQRAAYNGIKFEFAPKYLASNIYLGSDADDLLQQKGYVLCHDMFKGLGMRDAGSVVAELKAKIKLDPTPEQLERIAVLKESADLLSKLAQIRQNYDYKIKDVWLFDPGDANRNLLGQHAGNHVWISSAHLAKDYASVLATYLHEILHDHGSDGDRTFGYALTDSMGLLIDVLTRDAEQFKPLLKRWHRAIPSQGTTSGVKGKG